MSRYQSKNEQGSVMLIVLGILAVFMVLAAGLVYSTGSQTKLVEHLTGNEQSLYSAEKVANEYVWDFNTKKTLSYLKTDPAYIRTEIIDGTKHQAVYRPASYETGASYRAEIVIPMKEEEGSPGVWKEVSNQCTVRITSWEPVADDPDDHSRSRTIETEFVKRGFTNYSWISDSEVDENGKPVYWRENDQFYGPFHTNGKLYLYYSLLGTPPAFFGPASYGEDLVVAGGGDSFKNAADDSRIFRQGVEKTKKIGWPASNDYLSALAQASGGHYYNGRTCIMLKDDNYAVRSYDSATGHWSYNRMSYDFDPATNHTIYDDEGVFYYPTKTACILKWPVSGTTSFKGFITKAKSMGYVQDPLPLPDNGVIYVDGAEKEEDDYDGDTGKFDPALGNVFVSGSLKGKLTIAASNDIYITSYDPTNWSNPWIKKVGLVPGSRSAFSGFEATSGLKYSATTFTNKYDGSGKWESVSAVGEDMLGLAAQHNIRVLHRSWPAPISSLTYLLLNHAKNGGWLSLAGDNYGTPSLHAFNDATGNHEDITIQSALFCSTGSFGFEDPNRGLGRGTMYITGSVAGKFPHRPGDFGGLIPSWTKDGYNRTIVYDPRMINLSPPNFVQPTDSGFITTGWRESDQPVTEP